MAHGTGDRFIVGVTGHRDLGGAEDEVASALRAGLEEHHRTHGDRLVVLSAIAAGADSLFAEAATALGIPLTVVLPFEGYEEDFADGEEREMFETLLAAAERRCTLPYDGRSTDAYAAVGRWVVDHSDHLVAVWDGTPARGPGGTGDVVAYARERGHPVTVVTPPQT
jgi:hypothetical protein